MAGAQTQSPRHWGKGFDFCKGYRAAARALGALDQRE